MNEKSTKNLLILNAVILLILLVVLIRKEPVYVTSQQQSSVVTSGSSFESVQLDDDIIAIIHSDFNSSNYGEIRVLQYDAEQNSFNEVTDYNIFSEE